MKPMLTVHQDDAGVMRRFLDVPHRGAFAAGVLAILLLAGWWAMALGGQRPHGFPATMVHAVLMPLGVFPLFMLGFIFTAGPRWLNVHAPKHVWLLAGGYLVGLLTALIGFGQGGERAFPGLLLMLVSWSAASTLWYRCLSRSAADDARHGWRLLAAMVGGALALCLALGWVWTGSSRLWLATCQVSLWGFLLPVFLTVSHRMVPFFTQSALPQVPAWRPYGLLDAWLVACAALVATTLSGEAVGNGIVAIAFSGSLAYTSLRWGLRASFANRLLAMLHLSFAWLAPALLLQGLGSLGVPVGAAPAHALGLGFCVTMLVGFVTRVTLGHGGHPLQADGGYWAIYLGLHGVAVLRIAAALFALPLVWLHGVSYLWFALMAIWAARVLPIYLRRRADGKPG